MTNEGEPKSILARMAEETEEAEGGYCQHVYFVGSHHNPPEYCDNDAVEGSDYCELHQGED